MRLFIHQLSDSQQRRIGDVSHARLLAHLHDDPLLRESLTLLPSVMLIALLHVHTHLGWDACFAVARQLNHDHGRHMRELSTALSMLKTLRGTRVLDPLVWHAVARRVMHALSSELHAWRSRHARASPLRRAQLVRMGSVRRSRPLRKREWLALPPYWLAASASAPVTWL
ncbi:hypothetical protein [Paraburkholderia sp. C35]|uniref:hypothetical protein n=1 Tax=Paraburkholderia sp. C35 TaxID=2126993 RepID=UPI001EF64E60|nr:hypothetical protein [Paraburkholderia sp. C35]